jgi:thiopurine S-methyltransferase
MQDGYWQGRWIRGETGWHQAEAEPALVKYFSPPRLASRVLVPLCGKSLDLKWLIDDGHEVVGVDLSEVACQAFFEENKIEYEKKRENNFTVFRGHRISIYQGDFFSLSPKDVGHLDAVYDRAALIALPAEIRVRYAAHLLSLIGKSLEGKDFSFLQILLERVPDDTKGPPFSIAETELRKLYGRAMTVTRLSREPVEAKGPPGSVAFESVFEMKHLD